MAKATAGTFPVTGVTPVAPSTSQVLAKALSLGQTTGVQTDLFVLGLEQKGFIRDHFNRNNPASAYTQMVDIAASGAASITVKYDGNSNSFVSKSKLGNGDIKDIDQKMEILRWNTPVYKSEGLSAYDISKGVLNTLAYRMEKSLIRFTQNHIKDVFKAMEASATVVAAAAPFALPADLLKTASAKDQMRALIAEATKLVKETEATRGDVVMTVMPELFDNLAFAGLLGNRVEQTYAGGQYSVSTLGGYRIQSGEMFMPDKTVAIVALTNSVVSKMDVLAANTGKIELSNDLATYVELADIAVVPEYSKDYKFITVIKTA